MRTSPPSSAIASLSRPSRVASSAPSGRASPSHSTASTSPSAPDEPAELESAAVAPGRTPPFSARYQPPRVALRPRMTSISWAGLFRRACSSASKSAERAVSDQGSVLDG